MTQKNYSLCLTLIGQNNYSQLLRLADPVGKNGLTLWQLNGKTNRPDFLEIKTITMDPFSAKDNELAIWEWESDPDNANKQWSERTDEPFYELVFLDNDNLNTGLNIPDLDLEDKIDLMISGFKAQQFISDNLLLVFDKSQYNNYLCLRLKKSDYSVEDNVIKIKEGHLLDVHKISNEHCIDTNDYIRNISLNNCEIQRRIVYRERKLRDPINTIRIQSFLQLFKIYLTEIADRMNYSEEQRTLIQRTINSALENKNNIKDFFRLTGAEDEDFIFTQNTVKKFEEASQAIKKYASKKGIENFLESVIENTPDLKDGYIDILLRDYLADEKGKIEAELKNLEESKDKLEKEIKFLVSNKKDIYEEQTKRDAEIAQYNKKIQDLENRKEQLDQYFEDRIKYIKENSGAFLGEIAVLKGITQNQTSPDHNLTAIKSKLIEYDELLEINTAEELIDELEENLDNILLHTDCHSIILAKYIVGSYLSGLPILLIGNSSQILADAISATFCSRTPEIISLPTGFSNYQNLLKSVHSSESDVIFIKNAVGYCDEYIYLNLIKDTPDKFLLFSAEFHDTIKILPPGLLGYMGIIDCEEMISPYAFDEITPAKIGNIELPEFDKSKYRSLYRKISNYTTNSPLTNGYNLTRAKTLLTLSNIEPDQNNQLETVIPEIITYHRIQGTIDDYMKDLESDNPEYYDTVQKFLGGRE